MLSLAKVSSFCRKALASPSVKSRWMQIRSLCVVVFLVYAFLFYEHALVLRFRSAEKMLCILCKPSFLLLVRILSTNNEPVNLHVVRVFHRGEKMYAIMSVTDSHFVFGLRTSMHLPSPIKSTGTIYCRPRKGPGRYVAVSN